MVEKLTFKDPESMLHFVGQLARDHESEKLVLTYMAFVNTAPCWPPNAVICTAILVPPTLSPKTVILSGSPPKAAILSLTPSRTVSQEV